MPYAVILDFPDGSVENYEKVLERAGDAIKVNPTRSHHLMWETDNGITVLDVFDTVEDFEAIGPVLGPIIEDLGITMAPPRVFPLYAEMTAEGAITRHGEKVSS